MKKTMIITLSTLCFFIACKKEKTIEVPPVDHHDTFSCTIDGIRWVPKGSGLAWGIVSEYSNNNFRINARYNAEEYIQGIDLTVTPVYHDTTLTISNYNGQGAGQFFRYSDYSTIPNGNWFNYYPIGQSYTGELTISKLDTANHIMAGTFWFDAIDSVNNKTVQIREGRFDVTY